MHHAASNKPDPARSHFGHRTRIERIFDRQNPVGEAVSRVIRPHGDGGLRDNGACVQFRHHEMNRTSMEPNAVRQGALMRMQTAIGREERWMNVEKPPVPMADEMRRQDSHEACKDDQVDTMRAECALHGILERLSRRVLCVIDRERRNTVARRCLESFGIGAVRDDARNLCRIIGFLRSSDNRCHVGAASRNENADAPFHLKAQAAPDA